MSVGNQPQRESVMANRQLDDAVNKFTSAVQSGNLEDVLTSVRDAADTAIGAQRAKRMMGQAGGGQKRQAQQQPKATKSPRPVGDNPRGDLPADASAERDPAAATQQEQPDEGSGESDTGSEADRGRTGPSGARTPPGTKPGEQYDKESDPTAADDQPDETAEKETQAKEAMAPLTDDQINDYANRLRDAQSAHADRVHRDTVGGKVGRMNAGWTVTPELINAAVQMFIQILNSLRNR